MADEKKQLTVNFKETLVDALDSVQTALPKDFSKSRQVQNCLALLNDNPELAKYGTMLIPGILKASYLGLDFLNKECYLIPYGNTIQFQTSYFGEVKFTRKYSVRPIKSIYAKVVRQGDDFEEKIEDGKPSIDFKPIPFSDGEIVGAFAVCVYEDGEMQYEAMSIKEIQDVRNTYSKAKDSKAWKNSFVEMCKKVVLRRLCKHIDTDFDSVEARAAWEEGSGMTFKRDEPGEIVTNPFDVEAVVIEEVSDGTDE